MASTEIARAPIAIAGMRDKIARLSRFLNPDGLSAPMKGTGCEGHAATVANARRRFARVLAAWASDLLAISRLQSIDPDSAEPDGDRQDVRSHRW